MIPGEESRLVASLRAHLVEADGGGRLDYRQAYKLAVCHWNEEE